MKLTEIETLIEGRLGRASLPGLQLIFPNVPPDPDPPVAPYAVVSLSVDSVQGLAMDGTVNVTSGRLLVTVVVKEGQGNLRASQLRDSVIDLFPMGLRISSTSDSCIEFWKPPQPKTGYAQGGNWRLPLEIPFRA